MVLCLAFAFPMLSPRTASGRPEHRMVNARGRGLGSSGPRRGDSAAGAQSEIGTARPTFTGLITTWVWLIATCGLAISRS